MSRGVTGGGWTERVDAGESDFGLPGLNGGDGNTAVEIGWESGGWGER